MEDKRSSQDILEEIRQASQEVGEEDFVEEIDQWEEEAEGQGEEFTEEEEEEQEEEDDFNPEDYRGMDPIADAFLDEMRKKESREDYVEKEEGEKDFEKIRQFGLKNIEYFLQNDLLNLADRYGSDLVDYFVEDLRMGKIKIPPNQHEIENAHEDLFLKWLSRSKIFRKLDSKRIGEVIEAAAGPPLKCHSADIIHPERVKPVKRFFDKGKKEEFDFSKLSKEDIAEMVLDWVKKHPERFS